MNFKDWFPSQCIPTSPPFDCSRYIFLILLTDCPYTPCPVLVSLRTYII